MSVKKKKEGVWAVVDLTGHYMTEIFSTLREVEAYRRGLRGIKDGKFVKVKAILTYELPTPPKESK